MGTGSSDSPRAEAASTHEAVCAPDSASLDCATSSQCARSSQHDEQVGLHRQLGSRLRRIRRGPVLAGTIGSKVQRSISKRRQQLQDLDKDLLCLRILNECLPDQLVNEVRQQLQAGTGQTAAVQQVAKRRLTGLAGPGVRKLFLAVAGTLSASCSAVHAAKGVVCRVAQPLRLGRPVRLLAGPVLMPTSLYGPLLGAYVITLAARGALRQMALEVQQQQQHALQAAEDDAAEAVAGEHIPNTGDAAISSSSSSSASTARRIAMYQHAVRTSSTSVADSILQPLSKVHASAGSASSSSSPRSAPTAGQEQQHNQSKGKPWWAFWKHKQQQRQPQTDDDSTSAASNSRAQAASSAARCPSLPPTPGRQDTAAVLTSLALVPASGAPAAGSPRSVDSSSSSSSGSSSSAPHHSHSSSGMAVLPCPVVGQHSARLSSVVRQQQHQKQVEEPLAPAAECKSSSSIAPEQQPRASPYSSTAPRSCGATAAALAGVSETAQQHQPSTEHQQPAEDSHPAAGADSHQDADPQKQQLSVRTRTHASLHGPNAAAAAAEDSSSSESEVCTPCMAELEGQVSKLQRRWSSADNEAFLEELQAVQLRRAPSRPPVFSRLASGKGGCRITAAAAAQTAEEACAGCGGACGGAASPDSAAAAAAAAPSGALSPQRTGGLEEDDEQHVVLQMEQLGAAASGQCAAAGTAATPAGCYNSYSEGAEVCTLSSKQQQPSQHMEQQQQQRTYKSLDWSHRLATL